MVDYKIPNPFELHALLANTAGLKELELLNITFRNHKTAAPLRTETIFLDSLVLRYLDCEEVNSVMQSFTAVDILHLRSLCLVHTQPTKLLRANASTLREVKIVFDLLDFDPEPEDLDAPVANQLTLLKLEMANAASIHAALRLFGHPFHLTALRKVDFTVMRNIIAAHESTWRCIDAELSSAPRLQIVQAHFPYYRPRLSGDALAVRLEPRSTLIGWMPTSVEKGILYVFCPT
ncbi:hypothetical protein B0H19DRAFT_1261427 [Mycena capillaripes]|nr:hypothetical protein B0H19DRAFT_1261427 [Mycena capillaripes]